LAYFEWSRVYLFTTKDASELRNHFRSATTLLVVEKPGPRQELMEGVFILSFPPFLPFRFFSLPSPSLSLPYPFPSLLLPFPPRRSRAPLNQLCSLEERCELLQRGLKMNLVHSRAVRKPLVAIILSILKCMFYSRSIKT